VKLTCESPPFRKKLCEDENFRKELFEEGTHQLFGDVNFSKFFSYHPEFRRRFFFSRDFRKQLSEDEAFCRTCYGPPPSEEELSNDPIFGPIIREARCCCPQEAAQPFFDLFRRDVGFRMFFSENKDLLGWFCNRPMFLRAFVHYPLLREWCLFSEEFWNQTASDENFLGLFELPAVWSLLGKGLFRTLFFNNSAFRGLLVKSTNFDFRDIFLKNSDLQDVLFWDELSCPFLDLFFAHEDVWKKLFLSEDGLAKLLLRCSFLIKLFNEDVGFLALFLSGEDVRDVFYKYHHLRNAQPPRLGPLHPEIYYSHLGRMLDPVRDVFYKYHHLRNAQPPRLDPLHPEIYYSHLRRMLDPIAAFYQLSELREKVRADPRCRERWVQNSRTFIDGTASGVDCTGTYYDGETSESW